MKNRFLCEFVGFNEVAFVECLLGFPNCAEPIKTYNTYEDYKRLLSDVICHLGGCPKSNPSIS